MKHLVNYKRAYNQRMAYQSHINDTKVIHIRACTLVIYCYNDISGTLKTESRGQ